MPPVEPLLQLDAAAVGYHRQPVLRAVSMNVRAGDFWFLLGPNGTGKSTLIKLILGMIRPLAGRVHLHGDLADRQRIGFIPQRAGHRETMPTTVREFVGLGLVNLPLPRRDQRQRIAEALEDVGLADRAGADFWTLSGGQQQRALVARALVRKPHLLIVDEPTNGLDAVAEEALLHLLAELNRRVNLTLLFVTHDLATAARYGTHAALFHDGQVNAGGMDEVLTPANLHACYGRPIELQRHTEAVTVSMGRSNQPEGRT